LKYGTNNGVDLPKGITNKIVYVIDFSLKKGSQMRQLVKNNKKVVALDHHHDAEQFAQMAHEYLFDNNRSGATVAWSYFYPQKPAPLLLKYVEDLDIWRCRLPHTFEASAYLDLFDHDFLTWNNLVRAFDDKKSRLKIFEKGATLLEYENKKIQDLVVKNAELVKLLKYKVLAVNSPNWASKIGNLLCRKHLPFGIVWSKRGDSVVVSLRSEKGKFDVSKIARKFGGGGHKAAAAFSVDSLQDLPWKSLK
jgi:oligoribonuclease NrnB/cAMP/cGMP phosphodiesterase (DHH superfamily)